MTVRHLRLIAVAPLVGATLLVAVFTGLEVMGWHVLTDRPLNLAEAVFDDDPPALMRQLYAGVSAVDRYDIGSDLLLAPHGRMTPLEAATVRDHAPLFQLLLRQGVPLDGATRAHLLCLAGRANAREMTAVLAQPGVEPVCGAEADRVLPLPAAGGR